MKQYIKLAQINLENCRQTYSDDFLLNVSAQLAKESIQWSFSGILSNHQVKPLDTNDLKTLYQQVQPYLQLHMSEQTMEKLIRNNFLSPEGHEINGEEAQDFLQLAEKVYEYAGSYYE